MMWQALLLPLLCIGGDSEETHWPRSQSHVEGELEHTYVQLQHPYCAVTLLITEIV